MRQVRPVRVLATLAVLVCWVCLVGGGVAQAAPQKIAWAKCFGGPFQCGVVQVPLDYDNPGGASVTIALTRLPATDPAHRIGSLFLNPGGPGGPGTQFVVEIGQELYTEEVRARYDLVGFDPRGIGSSTAVRCFGTDREWGPFFQPFFFPTTEDELAQWIAGEHFLDDSCARRAGRIVEHMSTANVARDLDRLRAAVGDAKLHYAGFSYGSYLGTTYANMFPDKVGALVVDGVLDPIAWSTGVGDEALTIPFSTRLHSDAGAWATLQEFFRLCDAGGERCAFSGGAADRWAALAEQLRAHPVVFTFPDGFQLEVNYSVFVGLTAGALYDSSFWGQFAQDLADLESQAATKRLRAAFARFGGRPAYIARRGPVRYFNALEGFPAVACADSDNPGSYDAWWEAAIAADAAVPYFGAYWTWVSSICADWPFRDADRYAGPFDRRTANPVLVVGNTFDPATRYAGAQKVASLLPGSRLLTLHAWGHTSLFLSACADEAVARYLVDGQLPASGIVCEQDEVPFAE